MHLQQLFRDVGDEETQICEKKPIFSSTTRSKDLIGFRIRCDSMSVQNLLKKHQVMQAETLGHEPRIKTVTQKGDTMVEEGHKDKAGANTP